LRWVLTFICDVIFQSNISKNRRKRERNKSKSWESCLLLDLFEMMGGEWEEGFIIGVHYIFGIFIVSKKSKHILNKAMLTSDSYLSRSFLFSAVRIIFSEWWNIRFLAYFISLRTFHYSVVIPMNFWAYSWNFNILVSSSRGVESFLSLNYSQDMS